MSWILLDQVDVFVVTAIAVDVEVVVDVEIVGVDIVDVDVVDMEVVAAVEHAAGAFAKNAEKVGIVAQNAVDIHVDLNLNVIQMKVAMQILVGDSFHVTVS
jgi:hypothetical protein